MASAAVWTDRFTITGATPGESVDFLVKVSVDGALDVPDLRANAADPSRFNYLSSSVAMWLWGFPGGTGCQGGNGFGAPPSFVPPCNASGLHTISRVFYVGSQTDHQEVVQGALDDEFVVSLVVGQSYMVGHHLSAASIITDFAPATTAADFTASMTLTPIGSGYDYVAASGRRYDPPVTNTAPTAISGNNQTVRPGATVNLDGSGSFDDNAPTNELLFDWSFVKVPSGSTATLAGAQTMTPSFEPDVPGTYEVRLVVTDAGGLASAPSEMTVSENPPPSANAGTDQLVMVGTVVQLSGTGDDPDNDSLTFAWALNRPAGSTATLANPALDATTFIPDLPGMYSAQLTVSDPFGPGAPDTAQITAITANGHAQLQLQAASAIAIGLSRASVTNGGNQNALIQFLSNAVTALEAGIVTEAQEKITLAMSRTDGCALRGAPDGNGPGRDWITSCDAQTQIYPLLVDALAAVTP